MPFFTATHNGGEHPKKSKFKKYSRISSIFRRNEFIERRKGGDVAFTTVRYDIKGLENDWDDKNAR